MSVANGDIYCSFCNEEFNTTTIRDHLLICGNKTDPCPKCRKYIRRAIFAYHYENECADLDDDDTGPTKAKNPIVTIKCDICSKNYARSEYPEHKRICQQRLQSFESSGHRSNDASDEVLIPCEYCLDGIPIATYKNHTKLCQTQFHESLQNRAKQSNKASGCRNSGTKTDMEHKPCGFCKRLMSLTGIRFHELHCVKNPKRSAH